MQTKSEQFFQNGKSLYKLNDYQNAIKSLESSLKEDTEYNLAWKYIAFCQYQLNNFESAYQSFCKYTEKVKGDFEAINDSGCCNLAIGDYEKAVYYFNQIIELKPNEKEGYYNRGLAYYNQEKYAEAVRDFEIVLKINPKDENTLVYTSFCKYKSNDIINANLLIESLLREYPNNFMGYYLSIVYNIENGKKEKALEVLQNLNNTIASETQLSEFKQLVNELQDIISQIT